MTAIRRYNYALAVGFNASSLTNVQDIVTFAPTTHPDQGVSLGSVRRKTLDRKVHTHGARKVRWSWPGGMRWDEFEALILFIFGDFDTENAEISLATRQRSDLFSQYNTIASLPVEGEHYRRRTGGGLEFLNLDFEIISGPSEFTSEFSYEFTV